jgi:hypothetical protein
MWLVWLLLIWLLPALLVAPFLLRASLNGARGEKSAAHVTGEIAIADCSHEEPAADRIALDDFHDAQQPLPVEKRRLSL